MTQKTAFKQAIKIIAKHRAEGLTHRDINKLQGWEKLSCRLWNSPKGQAIRAQLGC